MKTTRNLSIALVIEVNMIFPSSGLSREIVAIFALYLAMIIDGMSWGFSAIAIPGMKDEMGIKNSTSFITKISATDEELSWFGKLSRIQNISIMINLS